MGTPAVSKVAVAAECLSVCHDPSTPARLPTSEYQRLAVRVSVQPPSGVATPRPRIEEMGRH